MLLSAKEAGQISGPASTRGSPLLSSGSRRPLLLHNTLLQMIKQSFLRTRRKMMFQPHNAHAAKCGFVRHWNELASFTSLNCHGRYQRDAHARRYHGQDRGELAALEYHVRLQARATTCCVS